MHKEKSRGPRIDPCGTPHEILAFSETWFLEAKKRTKKKSLEPIYHHQKGQVSKTLMIHSIKAALNVCLLRDSSLMSEYISSCMIEHSVKYKRFKSSWIRRKWMHWPHVMQWLISLLRWRFVWTCVQEQPSQTHLCRVPGDGGALHRLLPHLPQHPRWCPAGFKYQHTEWAIPGSKVFYLLFFIFLHLVF